MSLYIQYRGHDFKVDYNPREKDLNFAIKVTADNSNIDPTIPIDENKTLLKFAHLREYLKSEGFFPEFFSKEEDRF